MFFTRGNANFFNQFHNPRRARRGQNPFFMLLVMQLVQQIMSIERKPPVTIALMAVQTAIFLRDLIPLPVDLLDFIPTEIAGCLNPHQIWKKKQWGRLIWSALLHADEHHLYYNMASFLWKGVQLERTLGSGAFAALVLELLLVSHSLMVVACYSLAASFPEYRTLPVKMCAVGFSAVLFGLKVVLNSNTPGWTNIFGIPVPTKHLCWAELLLSSYLNPRASFLGHLAGITAGFIHVKVTRPLLLHGVRLGRPTFRSGGRSGFVRGVSAASAGRAPREQARAGGQPPAAPRQQPEQQQQQQAQRQQLQQDTRATAAARPPVQAASEAAAAAARSHIAPALQQQQQEGGGEQAARSVPVSAAELRELRLRRFGGLQPQQQPRRGE